MKRAVAILLVATLCVTLFAPLALSQNTAYQKGYKDGKQAANRDLNMVDRFTEALWGFLLGPFPVLHSLTSNPKVPFHRLKKLEDHNASYKKGFKEGYKETLKQTTLLSRIGGWGGWIGLWAVAFHT